MRTGDRIDVVLDCLTEERDGRRIARVFVRLADAPTSDGGSRPPALHPGAQRNVVQRWLGVADDQMFTAAFAIDGGPVESADPLMERLDARIAANAKVTDLRALLTAIVSQARRAADDQHGDPRVALHAIADHVERVVGIHS